MKLNNIKFIATAEFGKYLIANDWHPTTEFKGRAKLWESERYQEHDILQPTNHMASDFTRRVRDLVEVLAETQDKKIDQIVQELNEISEDIIRVRVIHSDVAHGKIAFNDGINLFVKTKELITSAARSLIKPQKGHYGGQVPEVVSNYFDELKLSQTEVGSYVLKVSSPIYMKGGEELDSCEEPFGRSVSNRIIHSIIKLEKAIDSFKETNNHKYFDEIVSYGVGAALCSALVGLSGKNKNRTIEISIQPSPFAGDENLQARSVTVPASDISIIEHAKNYYLENYTLPNYQLEGQVTELSRKPNDSFGEVTIAETLAGSRKKTRNVEIILNSDMYEEAIKAHTSLETVTITGTLIVLGRKMRLTEVKGFDVKKRLL